MDFRASLEQVLAGQALDEEAARATMEYLVGGEATGAQIGAMLAALRAKGCEGAELASFASVLRERVERIDAGLDDLVDTCGTGGGPPSFNLSTAAAIIAAAAGARVAKHGNRAVTSRCGSADVLEALGVRLDVGSEGLVGLLRAHGLAFLFAPALHPAMKAVGPARREIGVRTVFNQLGPLANPAGARRQVLGVWDGSLVEPMADALARLGSDRAAVVWGQDGIDEISPCAPTVWAGIDGGERLGGVWNPGDFGLEPLSPRWLAPGDDLDANAAILREAVSDADSPRCLAVIPGAAGALWVAGLCSDLRSAAAAAREAVADGRARAKLEAFSEASRAG